MLLRDKDDLGLQHPGALEQFHWGSGCGGKVKKWRKGITCCFSIIIVIVIVIIITTRKWATSILSTRQREWRKREWDTHTPQGTGTYLGKQIINIKQKTATQDRRHAKGKASHTNQWDETDLNRAMKEQDKSDGRWKGRIFKVVSAAWFIFWVMLPYHSPVCLGFLSNRNGRKHG